MHFVVQVITLVIFVNFWKAVYGTQETLGGLVLPQMLNYVILARLFAEAAFVPSAVYEFGDLMREGRVGIELLRPLDFQFASYVRNVAQLLVGLVVQLA